MNKVERYRRFLVFVVVINGIFAFSFINAQEIVFSKTDLHIESLPNNISNPILADSKTKSDFELTNNETFFEKKLLRGLALSFGYDLSMGVILLALPEHISQWDKANKLKWSYMKLKMKEAFTLPPVIDNDLWYINYIGHPYQGGFYFNNLRSQGVGFWESSAYLLGQSLFWEYIVEGWFERPSIQDMIVTPVAGAMVGELSHRATLQMQKNGFSLFEKIIVTVINPSWTINNGFKTKKKVLYFGL